MEALRYITRSIDALSARIRHWTRALRVQSILTLRLVPDAAMALRRAATPKRLVATGLLTVFVALPWWMFAAERSDRHDVQRAHRALSVSSAAEIAMLQYHVGSLVTEQAELRHLLLEAGFPVVSDNHFAVEVVATGYSSNVIETDSTPFITASNTRTRTGIVAMSRDLLRRYNPSAPFKFGDTVHITGVGDFVVEDSMNSRWRRRVDVWFPSRMEAFRFGRRSVTIQSAETVQSEDGETAYNALAPTDLPELLAGRATAGRAAPE